MALHRILYQKFESMMEPLHTILEGRQTIEGSEFKEIILTRGNKFSVEDGSRFMRVAEDVDAKLVYTDEYADLLAQDGIPPPPDPLGPCDERLW